MLLGILTGPHVEDVRRQIMKGRPLVDGFEWRLDFFADDSLRDLETLHQASALPGLFTNRGGSPEKFLHLEPAYCDVEYAGEWAERYPKTRFIVSHHDYEKTPEDLGEILGRMRKIPAYGYKIAVKSNSTIDMLRLLAFVKETGARLTGIPMGRLGQPGRIMGPVVGNFFDFAVIEPHPQLDEAGVLSAEEMHDRYRYRELGPFTALYALLGDPVEHSPSHITHNAVFKEKRVNKVYLKLQVKPDELKKFFEYAQQLPFRGFSVTMPLKECIIPSAGTINTLIRRGSRWLGENTDGKAAISLIEELEPIQSKRCLVIGAGGAGKAIAHEAIKRGAKVILLNRTFEKAREFTKQCGGEAHPLSAIDKVIAHGYDILIHATSAGFPGCDASFLEEYHLLPGKIILEAVAHPTSLLSMAQKRGCRVISGRDLFTAQAKLQFELWENTKEDY